uniref:Uncharacterized protein n=1 Tax=Amphimedon queenslandica TaxID=400682 RepID=A0A1X7VQG3_AMPQE
MKLNQVHQQTILPTFGSLWISKPHPLLITIN